ncbi:MAG: flagellar protein export ATPase FliI [Thermodesulfobacteriota bacterium]|nr:flagellar protein export ATPase FliI [Thermodesulfobacteriota bacterium]
MTPASNPAINWGAYRQAVEEAKTISVQGVVTQVIGMVIEGRGPGMAVGGICEIDLKNNGSSIPAEVVGFRNDRVLLMPLGEMRGIEPGSRIRLKQQSPNIKTGQKLLGRVIDGLGNQIDQKDRIEYETDYPLYAEPLNPLLRERISEPVDVGIRAINGLITIGKGQRIGIMSGSGVGKSVLMGMIARHTAADISVIALIGERGREVREFIERDLGEAGLRRSVVVVATSDQPPLIRMRGAYLATAIAEYFRDKGKDVILMMDSITRFAMSYREVGLAIGEPPTSRGYTPSVFAQLPKLLERAGTKRGGGSITGIYTVLVEGDDMNEPIADASRSIIDGHIVLSRDLAHENHYPAIDVLGSISRVMRDITGENQRKNTKKLINILATYRKAEDLINIGAYVKGSNPKIDYAVKMIDKVNAYLQQEVEERVSYGESAAQLAALFAG